LNKPTDRWTKDELCIYNHGYADLCKAVIKQWNEDGKPTVNRETIEAWTRIMLELSREDR
jgi:hypothetical protein